MADVPAPPSNAVQVVSSTWARDSHDLFDFEAEEQLQTQAFVVPKSSFFVRSGTEVVMCSDTDPQPPGSDPLLRLAERDGSFFVHKAGRFNSGTKRLWRVVRNSGTSSGHALREGDIMKLCRHRFRVRQLVTADCCSEKPKLKLDGYGTVSARTDVAGQSGESTPAASICRICLLEGSSDHDPLIAPCRCKGSIQYVHLGCLRHWISGRLNLSEATSGCFFYKDLACELCKADYPTYFHDGKESHPLAEVPPLEAPCIVLQNLCSSGPAKGFHVVSLKAEKVFKIGRGHECDVRIADVSISRFHASIRFHSGQFLLEDNSSKFGTLVATRGPLLLEPGATTSIQMGRTLLNFSAGGPDADPSGEGSRWPQVLRDDPTCVSDSSRTGYAPQGLGVDALRSAAAALISRSAAVSRSSNGDDVQQSEGAS